MRISAVLTFLSAMMISGAAYALDSRCETPGAAAGTIKVEQAIMLAVDAASACKETFDQRDTAADTNDDLRNVGARDAAREYGAPQDEDISLPIATAAIERIVAEANATAETDCRNASDTCAFHQTMATRARAALLSAQRFTEAYRDGQAGQPPADTAFAEEFLVQPGSDIFDEFPDVVIGLSPRDAAAGGRPSPILPQASVCAFITTGSERQSINCGFSDEAAATAALDANCDAECLERARAAERAMRPATALHALTNYVTSTPVIAELARLDALNAQQWDSYWFGGDEGRAQWPWEIWINGLFYDPEAHQSEGRWTPPEHAYIALHPGPGVAMYDTDGDDASISAVLEVAGYSWWNYDDEGQREHEWGASLIAAYSQSDVADDWGYGVMVRTPFRGINVAWVRREADEGDEDGLLLSINLNDFAKSFSTVSGACRAFDLGGRLCGAEEE